jgi:hypothetical protein
MLSLRLEGDAHGSLFERKILEKYEWELIVGIITENYERGERRAE